MTRVIDMLLDMVVLLIKIMGFIPVMNKTFLYVEMEGEGCFMELKIYIRIFH